jgi:hypothetical protein
MRMMPSYRKKIAMNHDGYYPYPSKVQAPPAYSDPTAYGSPYSNASYSGVYGPYATERERQLERLAAHAEARASVLEQQNRQLQRESAENLRKLTQWRLNIRTGIITFLSLFIVLWATVSILVQYPVLPWNMPSAIQHLLGQ